MVDEYIIGILYTSYANIKVLNPNFRISLIFLTQMWLMMMTSKLVIEAPSRSLKILNLRQDSPGHNTLC